MMNGFIMYLKTAQIYLNISFHRLRVLMDEAFPNANCKGTMTILWEGLSLPDQGDNHVLAAAIKAKAEFYCNLQYQGFPS